MADARTMALVLLRADVRKTDLDERVRTIFGEGGLALKAGRTRELIPRGDFGPHCVQLLPDKLQGIGA